MSTGIFEKLRDYFDPDEYKVEEITDLAEIKQYLESNASACWGQGDIGDTGYYQLLKASPKQLGMRALVFVCKKELT